MFLADVLSKVVPGGSRVRWCFQRSKRPFQDDICHWAVLSIDFPAKFQNWDTTDPSTLFDAPTLKNESNPKVNLFYYAESTDNVSVTGTDTLCSRLAQLATI